METRYWDCADFVIRPVPQESLDVKDFDKVALSATSFRIFSVGEWPSTSERCPLSSLSLNLVCGRTFVETGHSTHGSFGLGLFHCPTYVLTWSGLLLVAVGLTFEIPPIKNLSALP